MKVKFHGYLILATTLLSCTSSQVTREPSYWDKYNSNKELHEGKPKTDLVVHIAMLDSILHDGEDILLRLCLTNTGSGPYLVRKYNFGSITFAFLGSGLNLNLKSSPQKATLIEYSLQTSVSPPLPVIDDFEELQPDSSLCEIFNITNELFSLPDGMMGEPVIVSGRYVISVTYQNFHSLPELEDFNIKEIWMGEVESNEVEFNYEVDSTNSSKN